VRREGAAVVAVAPGSVGDRAGLRPGDTITLAGIHRAPTPAQVISAFAAATADRPLLAAISRGTEHRVVALEPR
jgi:S1-C subfamily serine protease